MVAMHMCIIYTLQCIIGGLKMEYIHLKHNDIRNSESTSLDATVSMLKMHALDNAHVHVLKQWTYW